MTTRRGSKPEMNRDEEERQERVPFGVPKLSMSIDGETAEKLKSEGMVPRWINDVGGRIIEAMRGGYRFVDPNGVCIGDARERPDSDRVIRKRVGTDDGKPVFAYLMAIPEAFYREDQAKKEEVNMQVDLAIKGGLPPGVQDHGVDEDQGRVEQRVNYQP